MKTLKRTFAGYLCKVLLLGLPAIAQAGNTTSGSGDDSNPVEDKMWVYFSRSGANTNDSGNRPDNPGPLSSDFVVGGNVTATLVADFTNKIIDHAGQSRSCELDAPDFSF